MKSPTDLAHQLARAWQRPDWRVQHLQGQGWPLELAIAQPTARQIRTASAQVLAHVQAWRNLAAQPQWGQVLWQQRSYQGAAAPVELPVRWMLAQPSQYLAAIRHLRPPGWAEIAADWQALAKFLPHTTATQRELLLRRPSLWRGTAPEAIVQAARMAEQLPPGCAQGRPLRALAVEGNDSKFFERHSRLLTALLDLRFDGQASAQGLSDFLGASPEHGHWLLLAPLVPNLLPFKRQRVPVEDLQRQGITAQRILLIENERCLHLLPRPVPDTVAILGAGLNLSWLSAPWLQQRQVAYWGDIDTWGLQMLASARQALPHLQVLLMDKATWQAHSAQAVTEPVLAEPPSADSALLPTEQALDAFLRQQERGRLEQEFIHPQTVAKAVTEWLAAKPAPSIPKPPSPRPTA